MEFFFAPLEGITNCIFRRVHARFFPGAAAYFAPFIVACGGSGFKGREIRDIRAENNAGVTVVPQLIGNDAAAFSAACRTIASLGYREVNLNLGCPSGTVTAKRRGAGLLAYPEALEEYLSGIFAQNELRVSVKTRLGIERTEEFGAILDIYERHPIDRLIIHPRVREDMYRAPVRLDGFRMAYERISDKSKLIYNGNIFTRRDFERVLAQFPDIGGVMTGRGAVANPALIRQLLGGEGLTREELYAYHDALYAQYRAAYSGEKFVLQHMKELWFYMAAMFPGSARYVKAVNKSQTAADYERAAGALMRECNFDPEAGFIAP